MLWSSSKSSSSFICSQTLTQPHPYCVLCTVCVSESWFSQLYRSFTGWLCVRAFFGCICTRYFSRFSSLGCQTAWIQEYENSASALLRATSTAVSTATVLQHGKHTEKIVFFFLSFAHHQQICWGENHTHTVISAMLHQRNVWENFRHTHSTAQHSSTHSIGLNGVEWSVCAPLVFPLCIFSVSMCVCNARWALNAQIPTDLRMCVLKNVCRR